MNRIIIDVTSTYESGLNTGIQRVVRNIARYIPQLAAEEGIDCLLVVFDGSRYVIIPELVDRSDNAKVIAGIMTHIKVWVKAITPKKLWPALQNLNTKIKLLLEKGKSAKEESAPPISVWCPAASDLLVLADATWNYSPWRFIRDQGEGIQIAHIIYDLLPINYPQFFTNDLVDKFKLWWLISNYYVDIRLCISQSTANAVAVALPKYAKNASANYVFPLGADIKPMATPLNSPEKVFLEKLDWQAETFLMVGTLEPRKNYSLVIDAFDQVWRQGCNSRLVIVGKPGWASPELMQRIQLHPLYGKELLWLERCNDDELEYCYRAASCLIAASIDEGYGLPIIEALSRGLNVLASDIEVFREVGKENVDYFELGNSSALADLLLSHSSSHKDMASNAKIESLTWKDASQVFFQRIKSL